MSYQWTNMIDADRATPIVELRRYALHPGRRDELIGLFEDEFIESQEAMGARVLGTFRVEAAPDQFVWLRGFPAMAARARALERFYGGPVWAEHRDAANATMIDSDDVHLLRAIRPDTGLPLASRRPGRAESVLAHDYTLVVSETRFPEMLGNYHLWLRLHLRKAGLVPLATFATLAAENNYPALPVWKNRPVHVALFLGRAELPPLPPDLAVNLRQAPEVLHLAPTARSLLR